MPRNDERALDLLARKYERAGSSFNAPVFWAAPETDRASIAAAGRPALEHFGYTYRNYTAPPGRRSN